MSMAFMEQKMKFHIIIPIQQHFKKVGQLDLLMLEGENKKENNGGIKLFKKENQGHGRIYINVLRIY